MTGYRNLEVWKRAKLLAIAVYEMTRTDEIKLDFGLVDQMRRASVSIASNIAEGDERDTVKDTIRFLYIAKASAAELFTQIEIAEVVYSLSLTETSHLKSECDEIAKMLRGLIKFRTTQL